ncbi:OmpA family protein [Bosea caraganae]|uniref:OmpA family protein n=1 Tax=Bosea caraganae TaxID=2763117 RepID=A0A370L797_9HYPH|nr:OmpA family protein [Bosea caraganae]RDJ23223.1 OmpA family protein [Bosea caraganae]RDJ24663.1 OmpA family protein [Bosea caraganae]
MLRTDQKLRAGIEAGIGMAQPAGWLWGLVPLALLWGAGNLVLGDAVQRDVARRAVAIATEAAGQAPGARAVTAQVTGRDVSISGEALSSDGASKAMAQLRAEFGVRRALGGLSQAVAKTPYGWAATRDGTSAVLSGFVPDEATARANVAAARTALPGLRIDDRQELAFGAPAGFAAMTQALLDKLSSLSIGKVALDDTRFCIEGKAGTPESFLALKAAAGQGDFKLVECNLEPPLLSPYRWSAEKSADGSIAVAGFYPSDETRRQIAAALRRSFPEPARIDDRTKPALGVPSAFMAKVTRAVADLARLRSGKAELNADAYALTGAGPLEFDSCQALRLLIAQTDGPDSVAQAAIECPPPPPPMPALPDIPPLSLSIDPPPAPVADGAAPVPAGSPAAIATKETSAPTAPSGQPLPSTQSAPAGQQAASASAGRDAASPPVAPPAPPPPSVALRWQAQKDDGGIVLSGLVRDEAARSALLEAARKAATSAAVEDRLTLEPNLRDTPEYGAATDFLLEVLGKLSRGSVAVDGVTAALAGSVADEDSWRGLEVLLGRRPLPGNLSGNLSLGSVGIRPYGLTIAADKSGASLSGYWPDAQARAAVLALLEASPLRGKVSDEARIVPGAPAGFGAAAQAAMTDLLRLDLGTIRLSEAGVEIQGLTCRDLIKSEIETSVASGLPAGISGRADIGLRQTGCVIDPPNTCQNDLDALTKRYSVLFGQGTAVVVLDPITERAVAEASGILKQCPAARVTVEGHANRDGERYGFDNLDLSNRRAQRVRDELVKRGIEAAQLVVKGYGAQRPLVGHDEPEAKVKNRRVQFTVEK